MTGRDYHRVLVCTAGGGHDRRELAVLVPVRSRDDLAAMADPDVYAPSPDGEYAAALAWSGSSRVVARYTRLQEAHRVPEKAVPGELVPAACPGAAAVVPAGPCLRARGERFARGKKAQPCCARPVAAEPGEVRPLAGVQAVQGGGDPGRARGARGGIWAAPSGAVLGQFRAGGSRPAWRALLT